MDEYTTAKSNHQLLLDSLARSEATLQAAEAKEKAIREKYGFDHYELGTVICFDYVFKTPRSGVPVAVGITYQYVILKCERGWYTSGPSTHGARTWEQMISFWERGEASNFKVAKSWKTFKPILPPHIQETHGTMGVVS